VAQKSAPGLRPAATAVFDLRPVTGLQRRSAPRIAAPEYLAFSL
jgi:hypothetical protein